MCVGGGVQCVGGGMLRVGGVCSVLEGVCSTALEGRGRDRPGRANTWLNMSDIRRLVSATSQLQQQLQETVRRLEQHGKY